MANSDKNIVITPNTGTSSYPAISFTGSNASPITVNVLDTGTVSFSATAGQLFSISDGLSGSIFSVNDISGIPSIELLDTGLVKLNQYGGSTVFGSSAAIQNGSSVNAKVSISTVSATTPGLIIKAASSQTANLQEWQNSSGTILTRISSDGSIYKGATNIDYYGAIYTTETIAIGASNTQRFASGGMTIINRELATSIPFGVKGLASQTGDLTQWRNSADTILSSITSDGRLKLLTNYEAYATLQATAYTSGAHAARFRGQGSVAVVRIETVAVNSMGIEVIGTSGQTADLQIWQDAPANTVAKIDANGMLTLSSTTVTSNDPITIVSKNQHGGSTYAGFITLTNATSGATNPNKFIRLNGSGSLEIVNSSYGNTIFSLADSGNLSIAGTCNGVTLSDSGWTTPTLSNSFVSGGTTPGYRLLNGVVYFRGNINSGTTAATAFTLPSGYRPAQTTVIAVQKFGTPDFTYITINTDGTVQPAHSSAWLSGVSFPIG